MGKTLATSLRVRIAGTHIDTRSTDLEDVVITDPMVLNYINTMTNGTGSGSSNLMYHEHIEESGASETIFDLSSLASSPGNFSGDAFGADITFAFVKFIMVRQVSDTGTLLIGGTTAAEWFDTDMLFAITNSKIHVPASGLFVAYSPTVGWPVDDNSKDKFIINTSASAHYDIVLIGTSA